MPFIEIRRYTEKALIKIQEIATTRSKFWIDVLANVNKIDILQRHFKFYIIFKLPLF